MFILEKVKILTIEKNKHLRSDSKMVKANLELNLI
jgi:hypothetical protein